MNLWLPFTLVFFDKFAQRQEVEKQTLTASEILTINEKKKQLFELQEKTYFS